MTTTASKASSIEIAISVDNPFAEIFLITASYELLARGIGNLSTRAVPGIYKIKTRLGRHENETVGLYNEDATVHLQAPKILTPMPLDGTAETHEYQIEAARRESQMIHVSAGQGISQVFVMARHYSVGSRSESRNAPGKSITLHSQDGTLIADYGKQGVLDLTDDPWSACTVALDRGAYILRSQYSDETAIEQTVYASPGWQTQIFLLTRSLPSDNDEPAGWTPDIHGQTFAMLSDMAVSMAKIGDGFDPSDSMLQDAEIVRLALTEERALFSDRVGELLDGLLTQKFVNPMLGIYGAHLMLMARTYDNAAQSYVSKSSAKGSQSVFLHPEKYAWARNDALYDKVIRNLRFLLGNGHPDVEALSLECGDFGLRATTPFTIPPLLRRDWTLLVKASNAEPTILPINTWRGIAEMVPLGPFLAWREMASSVFAPLLYYFNPRIDYEYKESREDGTDEEEHDLADEYLESTPQFSHWHDPLRLIESAVPQEIRSEFSSDEDRRTLSMELDVPRVAINELLGAPGQSASAST